MMAAVETPKGLCIVYWTRRSGLSLKIRTYCGEEHADSSRGVVQVPAVILDGAAWFSVTEFEGKRVPLTPCPACKKALGK